MDKKALRAEIRAKKRALTEAQIVRYSEELAQKLFAHPLYQAAKEHLRLHELQSGGPHHADSASGAGGRQARRRAEGLRRRDEVPVARRPEPHGVRCVQHPEPVGDEPEAADETALILMPGLAFDPAGHRCGYGGGFYDEYLAAHKNHPTIALCYGFQMYDHLDVDEFDIPVDAVIAAEEDAE